ncbi:MAG: hypothetical protein FVQ80_07070 [Planctomycetes bacterium]|nr:hypothetical protein [Planctomycetota bacterium]
MVLNAQGKLQNVKASVEKYVNDKLVVTEGFTVNYEGHPFEVASAEEWIDETILGLGDFEYVRGVDSSSFGQLTNVILNFNIFVNKEKTLQSNRHYVIRDIIFDYFKIGTTVNMYDFSEGNFVTVIQTLKVREVVTDSPLVEDNYFRYTLTFGLEWLQKWNR